MRGRAPGVRRLLDIGCLIDLSTRHRAFLALASAALFGEHAGLREIPDGVAAM